MKKCTIGQDPDTANPQWKCDGETTNGNGICDGCKNGGWGPATVEDFANDPNFILGVQSPVQRHDL